MSRLRPAAQELYFVTTRGRFACWRCSGLQYTTAAKHNARVYQLAADPEALIAEMKRVNRLGLASLGVMRAMERRAPALFRRPEVRR